MQKTVTKAVIPVAGLGSRLLPITKSQPKEMALIVDRPVIHYIVEEAVLSGINEIIFITNEKKRPINEYFERDEELERYLTENNKEEQLETVKNLHKLANFTYINQDEPNGSGDAILRAREIIDDEPFAAFYADDIIETFGKQPALASIIEQYNQAKSPGLSFCGLINVPKEETSLYGIIKGKQESETLWKIQEIIEKPKIQDATTTLASVGRFILNPDIFELIEKSEKIKNEVYLATALDALAKNGKLYGKEIEGKWLDCGSKKGLWEANIVIGARREEISPFAKKFLLEEAKKLK